MIRTIIKQILPDLQAVNFTDLVCGVVTQGVRNIQDEGTTVARKVFPMYENDPIDCKNGDYVLCVPDEKYRSLIYFEEVGNTITTKTNYEIKMSSEVRMVVWWDTKQIGNTITSAELMGLLIQNMPEKVADISNLFNIKINLSGIEKKSANIFSSYTYDEAETQYLIFPYDYGSIVFTVTYSVNLCLEDIDLFTNCGKRNSGDVIYNVIENSDGTFHISIGCGVTYILPDIVFTDSDGTVYSVPSMTDITALLCGGSSNMKFKEVQTGAITAGAVYTYVHNLGLDYVMLQLHDGENQYLAAELKPTPGNEKNEVTYSCNEDIPGGLVLKIFNANNS